MGVVLLSDCRVVVSIIAKSCKAFMYVSHDGRAAFCFDFDLILMSDDIMKKQKSRINRVGTRFKKVLLAS